MFTVTILLIQFVVILEIGCFLNLYGPRFAYRPAGTLPKKLRKDRITDKTCKNE
jgi:hypothetical protein